MEKKKILYSSLFAEKSATGTGPIMDGKK